MRHTLSHEGRHLISFHGPPGLPKPASVNTKGPVICFQRGNYFLSPEHHFIILISSNCSSVALALALLGPVLDSLPWGWVSDMKVMCCFCAVVAARRSHIWGSSAPFLSLGVLRGAYLQWPGSYFCAFVVTCGFRKAPGGLSVLRAASSRERGNVPWSS